MIQITRKGLFAIPHTLTTTGADLTLQMITDYESGVRVFTFHKKIYGARDVKAALIAIQNYKCAFCEARIGHIDDGDVEHFRPKKGYKQDKGQPLETPGYFWLAYDWNNLFLSCTKCNQRSKGNLFPLLDISTRADHSHGDVNLEQPFFIHPFNEDPSMHITFKDENPIEVNGSIRGKKTIDSLKLDRSILSQDRAERLNDLKLLYTIVSYVPLIPANIREEALNNLWRQYNEKTLETYPYAGMFRAYFTNNPIPAN